MAHYLQTKINQVMKQGLPYYTHQLWRMTGCDERMSIRSFEKRLGEIDSVYWYKKNKRKYYVMTETGPEPVKYSKIGSMAKRLLQRGWCLYGGATEKVLKAGNGENS